MYKFIKEVDKRYTITENDIEDFEREFSLKLTDELKKYLLKYNGLKMDTCKKPEFSYFMYKDKYKNLYAIHEFLPLKIKLYKGELSIDDAMRSDINRNKLFNDKYLPKGNIPIASDPGGALFYYNILTKDIIFFNDELWNMDIPNSGINILCNGINNFLNNIF